MTTPAWARETLKVWAQYLAVGASAVPAAIIYDQLMPAGRQVALAFSIPVVLGVLLVLYMVAHVLSRPRGDESEGRARGLLNLTLLAVGVVALVEAVRQLVLFIIAADGPSNVAGRGGSGSSYLWLGALALVVICVGVVCYVVFGRRKAGA